MVAKHLKNQRGQSAIEMALTMPLIIWLLYYTINAYYSIHTAHIGQKYAALNLWQRINNRSKYVVDDVAKQVHNREYMAVRYTDAEGKAPRRRIVRGPATIMNVIGICREPGCN